MKGLLSYHNLKDGGQAL